MKDHAPSAALIRQLGYAADAIKGEFWDDGAWGSTIARDLYSRIQEDIALFTKMRGGK